MYYCTQVVVVLGFHVDWKFLKHLAVCAFYSVPASMSDLQVQYLSEAARVMLQMIDGLMERSISSCKGVKFGSL